MRLSLRWLNDFVDIGEYFKEPASLGKLLTEAGLEVEAMTDQGKSYQNVVIGNILEKDKHPNADRLTLCQVTTGDGVVHQIVCGAKNHNVGDRVVVALPGAVLPGDFAIKHSKIRGVESGGMLCSEKELGLLLEEESEASQGILILPSDAPIGKSFAKYRGLDDVLMDIKVTPNRADCLSHYGLALEIGCLLGREVKKPASDIKVGDFKSPVQVEIQASDLGPRYCGRMVRGVKVGPSPAWLKSRLEAVGAKSINNVVDVTNYVMFEMGQPLHAFDLREIKGAKIFVSRAKEGEVFTTLDGTELKLDGSELTIRDAERAVALAGVIGGKNSGVEGSTTDVYIESAYFTPAAVRRTMRKFGLETDSGYRFSRGVNPEMTSEVLERATALMIQAAGGEASADFADAYPNPVVRPEITVRLETVEQRLGYKIEAASFEMWMKRLGGELKTISPGLYKFISPAHRQDLFIEMDLVEEFARLNGYDKIGETLPSGSFSPASHDDAAILLSKVRRLLSGFGCLEAINYSFLSEEYQKEFLGDVQKIEDAGLYISEEDVHVVNPLNEDLNVMRRSLLPGLYRNLVSNFRSGNQQGRLFEVGPSLHRADSERTERYPGTSFGEELRLGIVFWGSEADLWGRQKPPEVTMVLKGVLESFWPAFGLGELEVQGFDHGTGRGTGHGSAPEFLHPGKSAKILARGKVVGFLGALHPSLLTADKVRVGASVCEITLDKLSGLSHDPQFQRISVFPTVERDVAFTIEKSVAAGELISHMKKAAKGLGTEGSLLQSLSVFDVFEGESLGEGKRSIAIRMAFQSLDSTLSDETINGLKNKLVDAACHETGAVIRV